MIKSANSYTARSIVTLDTTAFLTALNGWALAADTLALSLTTGTYSPVAAVAHAERVEHSLVISTIWCESRAFVGLPGTEKALAMISRAIQVDVFPAL